jgi:hypothetical protein
LPFASLARRAGAAGLLLGLLAAPAAEAQSARPPDVAEVNAFATFVVSAVGFSALPGISAAEFSLDLVGAENVDVTRLALPLERQWSLAGLEGAALHTEFTLSAFEARRSWPAFLAGTIFETSARSTATAVSGVAGLGLAFPVGRGVTLTPLVTLGYGRLEDDTDFAGGGVDIIDRATRGRIFNISVEQVIWGPALQLDHARALPGDLGLSVRLRADAVLSETTAVSDL